MVNCPKCNFLQPKDRYCAQCGIDMDHYSPAPPSLLRRILVNPSLYIFTFIAIVLAVGFYIKIQPEKFRAFESNSQVGQYKAVQQPPSDLPTETPLDTMGSELATASGTINSNDPDTNHINNESEPAQTRAATPNMDLGKINITFSEVTVSEIVKIKPQYRYGDFFWGSIAKSSKPRGSNFQNLTKILDNNFPIKFFAGTKVSPLGGTDLETDSESNPKVETDQGLTLSILNYELSADGVAHGSLEITKQFKDINGNLQKSATPLEFEIPKDSYFVVGGVIPPARDTKLEDEELTNADPFLQIYRKDNFKNRQSDLVIFLDIEQANHGN